MFSVTSDIAVNVSFHGASPKPARAHQSPAPDSFSALVDSNAATETANDRATSVSQDQPAPQRRDSDTPAVSDNRPARRDTPSADSRAKANSDNGGNAAGPSTSVDANIGAETSKPSKHANSETIKTGIVKLVAKAGVAETADAPDIAAPADQVASAPVAEAPAAVQAAIAVAIPVITASVNVSAAPAPTSNTQAPLAIAAAAIAASSSDIGATTPTASAPVQTAPEDATPATPTFAAVAAPTIETAIATASLATPAIATTDPTSTAKIDVQAAAIKAPAIPINQLAAQIEANGKIDPKLATAVAVAAPTAPIAIEAASNTSIAALGEKTASKAAEADTVTASPQAAVQTAAIDSKPKAADVAVETSKPDATPSVANGTSSREHVSATVAAHTQIASPDQTGPTTSTLQQPQIQSNTPTAVSASQLSVTAATSAPVPLNGLALQIAVTAQSGKSRFEIRLDPAELGRIDVRIDVDRHGQVTSHLTVEKPETLAMLRQDAPHLQRALDDAGLKTGDSGLQFSLRDQSPSGQKDGNGRSGNSQRLIIGEEDIIPAIVAERTYGRTLGSSGGVDIRV